MKRAAERSPLAKQSSVLERPPRELNARLLASIGRVTGVVLCDDTPEGDDLTPLDFVWCVALALDRRNALYAQRQLHGSPCRPSTCAIEVLRFWQWKLNEQLRDWCQLRTAPGDTKNRKLPSCPQDMAVELLHRDEERAIVRLGKGATSAIFDLSRVCSFELGRGGSGFFSAEVVIRLHVTNERTKILRFHFETVEEAKAAVRAVDKLLPASAMRQHWDGDGTLYSVMRFDHIASVVGYDGGLQVELCNDTFVLKEPTAEDVRCAIDNLAEYWRHERAFQAEADTHGGVEVDITHNAFEVEVGTNNGESDRPTRAKRPPVGPSDSLPAVRSRKVRLCKQRKSDPL